MPGLPGNLLDGLLSGGLRFAPLLGAVPDATNFSDFQGSLVLSKAMYQIAQTALAKLGMAATSNGMLQVLFLGAFLVMGLNLAYEASKVILRASHKSFLLLLSPDLVKKFIRAAIFSSLALGSYGVMVTGEGGDYPVSWVPVSYYEAAGRPFVFFQADADYNAAIQAGGDPVTAAQALPMVKDLQTAVTSSQASGTDFGTTWVGTLSGSGAISPEVLLAVVNMRITDASSKIGAWSFVTELQNEAMKDMGTVAAQKVWAKAGADGTTPGEGGGMTAAAVVTAAKDLVLQAVSSIITGLAPWLPQLLNVAESVVLTIAYFAMDLMIVKILWMNAIYLALSYKLALLLLPVAFMLAYFPAMTGVLSGIGRHVVVCALSFNLFSMAVATLINPDFIKTTISTTLTQDAQATKDSSVSVPDAATELAQQVYVDMKTSAAGQPISQRDYIDAVRARMSAAGMVAVSPGLNRYTFYPVIALLMLAFLVSLVGKIATILQDSLSGTMTYHRSG